MRPRAERYPVRGLTRIAIDLTVRLAGMGDVAVLVGHHFGNYRLDTPK